MAFLQVDGVAEPERVFVCGREGVGVGVRGLGNDAVSYLDFDSQLVSYYAFISVIYIFGVVFWQF